jgi:hypothetical protein
MIILFLYFLFFHAYQPRLHFSCPTELQLMAAFENNFVGTTVPCEVSQGRYFAGYAVHETVVLEPLIIGGSV